MSNGNNDLERRRLVCNMYQNYIIYRKKRKIYIGITFCRRDARAPSYYSLWIIIIIWRIYIAYDFS